MTKKDYIAIASAIETAYATHDDDRLDMRFLKHLSNMVADKLSEDNPRFDRAKFLKACGVTPS